MGPVLLITRQANEFHGRGINLAVISIVFTVLALFLVGSRLATRWAVRQALGGCDITITISVFVSVGLTVTNCIAVAHGLGKFDTTLSLEDLHLALKAFWVAQILYAITTMLTKTSIVFMYMRIFPDPKFHRIGWLVVAYVNLCGIAGIGATVEQCTLRERIWDKSVDGTCINLVAFWYSYAAANMLGDFVILALPVPVVKGLNLPRRQKLGLLLVFALGGFVCITSILRMTTLTMGAKTTDSTSGVLDTTIWSTIEANTAIICACLPMLKAPLAGLCPQLFPRGSNDSNMTCPSISKPFRQSQSSTTANLSSHSYDNWGRLESQRQMDMMRVSTGTAKPSPPNPSTNASLLIEEVLSEKSQGRLQPLRPDAPQDEADDHRLDSETGQESSSSSSNNGPRRPQCAHVRGGSEAQLIRNDRSPNDMV